MSCDDDGLALVLGTLADRFLFRASCDVCTSCGWMMFWERKGSGLKTAGLPLEVVEALRKGFVKKAFTFSDVERFGAILTRLRHF